VSRGIATGDLDGDLVPDLVRTHVLSPAQVLLVRPTAPLEERLLADLREASGAVALGARVWDEARPQAPRTVRANSGYLCASDPRILFAGRAGERTLRVRWADGTEERFGPLAAGAVHRLQRGQGDRP
jgi:hypothetical protein